MITKNRLRIDRSRALNAAMGAIMELNGGIVIEERYSKQAYEESIKFLNGIKEDLDNALDEKIEEIKKS